MNGPDRAASCDPKTPYGSWRGALHAIRVLRLVKDERGLHVYRCPWCRCAFHVGHVPAKKVKP